MKPGLREHLAAWLDRVGVLTAVTEVRRRTPIPTASILTYHHIHEVADAQTGYLYNPDVADATPAQFRRHLEAVARFGTPIGIETLLGALHGGPLPPNPVMITFDDGYRSCHDVALPILRELGIPATFFIATTFVTQRRLYWWEAIAMLLARARGRTAILTYPYHLEIDASAPHTRRQLEHLVKTAWMLDIDRFVSELAAALDVEWTREIETAHANELIMTWDEIRALAAAGMDIESHTRRHRVLQTLDAAAMHDELLGSRLDLEAQLGRPVRAIAYPVGKRVPGDVRVRTAVAAAGYQIGLHNSGGINALWPSALRGMLPIDPLDLRRIATERSMSDAMFLTQVAVPPLGYVAS